MTRGLWNDPERYLQTYWSRWPGVWNHGYWASVDEDGCWFLHGRADESMNVAGRKVGPAEVESAAVSHPVVLEAAAVGIPHEIKGETVVVFAVLRAGHEPSERLREEIRQEVGQQLGKALLPEEVRFVQDLPKTRNAKILRRVIRATYLDREPGDLSSLENPTAIAAIRASR